MIAVCKKCSKYWYTDILITTIFRRKRCSGIQYWKTNFGYCGFFYSIFFFFPVFLIIIYWFMLYVFVALFFSLCEFARKNNCLPIIWFAFLLQTSVNLKEYDNTLYANSEDLAAEWLFCRLTWNQEVVFFNNFDCHSCNKNSVLFWKACFRFHVGARATSSQYDSCDSG